MLSKVTFWALRSLVIEPVSAQLSLKRRAAGLDLKRQVALCIVLAALLGSVR